MGRIKGTLVKRVSKEIMKKYRVNTTNNYETNKQFLNQFKIPKKTRNSIAGYIARKVKKEEELERIKKAKEKQ